MKRLKQSAKIMVLLLTGSMLTVQVEARHRLSKSAQKQATTAENNISVYSLKQAKGKITISDGLHETTVSQDPNDVQAVMNGNEVYYIKKAAADKTTGASICVYNIATLAKEDIIKQNATAANYDPKNEIENIIIDKNSNKLYFSTAFANVKGQPENQTWKYDINSKQLQVYKDGAIESIDNAGNQTIVFHGIDSRGQFSSHSVVNAEGKLQKVLDKQYNLTSTNK